MTETTILTAIKATIMAAIMNTFGIYSGATLIAFIAALCRLAYSPEKASLPIFSRFFIMSLSLTMLMVHVGHLKEWSQDFVIIISGVSAFMCRELLEFAMSPKNGILNTILSKIK